MEGDRACWDAIIENRLRTNAYQSLDQGFNDLIAYSRAGSFTQALLGIQSSAATAADQSKAKLQNTKNGVSGQGTGDTGTSDTGTSDRVSATQNIPRPAAPIICGAGYVANQPLQPQASTPLQSWTITFASGATLDPAAKTKIQEAANAIIKSRLIVAVMGHADTTGIEATNKKIAQQRADAVKAELIVDRVPASQISAATGDISGTRDRTAIIQQQSDTAKKK